MWSATRQEWGSAHSPCDAELADGVELDGWLADTAKYPFPFPFFFPSFFHFRFFYFFRFFSPTIMEHRCNSVLHVNKLNPCLRLGLALLAGRGGALVFDG